MKRLIIVIAVIIFYSKLQSQIVCKNILNKNYPRIELGFTPFMDRSDTLLELKFYYKTDSNYVKVGRLIEYYNSGKIKRIGYWNIKNDTFSLDSSNIIIFINPNKNLCLKQFIKKGGDSTNSKFFKNYNIVTEPIDWNIWFYEDGQIYQECIEENDSTIRITHFKTYKLFERFKNKVIIDSWEVK